jgi:hypothetical protein
MTPTGFTFLNATNTSALSQSESKRMRAHITRTNFAKRRQRLAAAETAEPNPKYITHSQPSHGLLVQSKSATADLGSELPLAMQSTDVRHFNKFRMSISLRRSAFLLSGISG